MVIERTSAKPWVLLLLLMAAVGAAIYFGYPRWQADRAEADRVRDERDQLLRKAEAVAAAQRALETQVKALEEQNVQLQQQRDNLGQEVQRKDAQISQLQSTYDSLQEKLKAEINKGDIRLTQNGGRISVDLVDKILFDSGQAAISPRGLEVLARVGAVLAKVDDKQIQVSGHTDNTPITGTLTATFSTNWELSAARAVNVVKALAEQKVPSARMLAAGYGEFHPVANNANPQGRARNRRIEILLTPLIESKMAKQTP
jgi:chemotaxis protein MotB